MSFRAKSMKSESNNWVRNILILCFCFMFQATYANSETMLSLMDSSKYYSDRNELQKSIKFAQLALEKADTNKIDTNYIALIEKFSVIYYALGKLDSAIFFREHQLESIKKIYKIDNEILTKNLGELGDLYNKKGNYAKAEKLFIEALRIDRNNFKTDNQFLAVSINNLGYFYYKRGDYKKAEPLYLEALQMFRKVFKTDNLEIAACLNNLSSYFANIGEYSKAEPLQIEALEILRRLYKKDNQFLAASINNLGLFYSERGVFAKAESLILEALQMRRRLYKTDHSELASSIANTAAFYKKRGDYSQAEKLYIESLEMRKRLFKTDHPDLANNLNSLGSFYFTQGDLKRAEEYFLQALEMRRNIYKKDHIHLANSLVNAGSYYTTNGQYDKAEKLLMEALEMNKRLYIADHPDMANNLNYLGTLFNSRGDKKNAEEYYLNGLKMLRRLYNNDNPYLAKAINKFGAFYARYGINDKAESLLLEGMDANIGILNNYFPSLSEKEKKLFWSTMSNSFEIFNNYAVQRYITKPTIASNMYDIQLYTKGLLINSSLKVKNRILSSGDSLLVGRYKELLDKNEILSKAYSMSKDERGKKNINIDSLEILTNNLEKELSMKSELFSKYNEKSIIDWKNIQSKLKENEAAVEVVRIRYKNNDIFTDTIYYAFLIITKNTKDNPELLLITDGFNLENDYYKEYRLNVKNKFIDNKSFARYWGMLYNKIKKYKKIIFSPDGVYNKLNPSTFMMPNGKYLLEVQEIQQVNSTKEVIGLKNGVKDDSDSKNAILIGNPNFSLPEDRMNESSRLIRGIKNNDEGNIIKNDNSERTITGLKRDIALNNLPGTEIEINNISKFLKDKKWDVVSYMGDLAVKTAIKNVNNPRLLHIATHGMFLSDINKDDKELFGIETQKLLENPLLRSGLFFAGANNNLESKTYKEEITNDENGILTAFEAMNLNLDKTELVVLSACETGLGEIRNGEGVYGLQRAFRQAGARTIIMSLWSVSDDATQELMSKFYSYWVSGISKRDSFNKAQINIKLKYKDPYYWGAFVMVGE